MIKLRLKRFGKKREVSYRIVAMPSQGRRDGRPLEELGYYNPRTDETRLEVPAIVRRLQQGAQPTPTVRSILEKANVFEQLKGGSAAVATATQTATVTEPAAPQTTAVAEPEVAEAPADEAVTPEASSEVTEAPAETTASEE